MVSVSFGIGRKLRPIFSFGFGIGPKPKRWFHSYTRSLITQLTLVHKFDMEKVITGSANTPKDSKDNVTVGQQF